MIVCCLKCEILKIKQYFIHLFVLFLRTKDVIFIFIIHISTFPSYLYCNMQTRYWVTTSKQITKQHSLLGSIFLISKYTQSLLSNAFVNEHNPTETIGEQKNGVFYYAVGIEML
jgi:hypothetical protein